MKFITDNTLHNLVNIKFRKYDTLKSYSFGVFYFINDIQILNVTWFSMKTIKKKRQIELTKYYNDQTAV